VVFVDLYRDARATKRQVFPETAKLGFAHLYLSWIGVVQIGGRKGHGLVSDGLVWLGYLSGFVGIRQEKSAKRLQFLP
jgi:hypothetical protein